MYLRQPPSLDHQHSTLALAYQALMMLTYMFVLPFLPVVLAMDRRPHLFDAGLTTVTSSTTVTEEATLTVTELVNTATDTTVIENVTVTFTNFTGHTTTTILTSLEGPSQTENPNPSTSQQNVVGFRVLAFSPDTLIHDLPLQAAGHKFWLGGEPAAYCPEVVEKTGGCPPGNVTTVNECSMAVNVPGGQAIYATADGSITYSVSHSVGFPNPLGLEARCPFYYEWTGGQYGELRPAPWAFDADSFMACPAAQTSWQVLLSLPNATVPSGNISDCIKFDAITINATSVGAWQYD